jgi:acid phosphatase
VTRATAWGIAAAALVLFQSSLLEHFPALANTSITESQTFGAANSVNPPHIMIIVDENKAYSKVQGTPFIIGNSSAPYINSLASKYASATHWYANQHGSPDDYLDLISGSNQGLGVGTKPPYTATSLVDELNSAHISWKAYMQAMPSNCYNGGTTGLYESDHNPFVYFKDYKSLCSGSNGVVPYSLSSVSSALNSSTPPDFVWVTPNICDDMHTNGGSCGTNAVADGDTWLSKNLPTVLSSKWYTSGGIIIITWDESDTTDTSGGSYGNGGHVATLVIAANAHGAFTASGDHYATLRGIEQAYGVALLGNSAHSSYGDLGPAF